MTEYSFFKSFKEVGVYWKESLKIISTRQFWLITLNAARQTYAFLFKKLWLLLGIFVSLDFLVRIPEPMPDFAKNSKEVVYSFDLLIKIVLLGAWFLVWSLLVFCLFLIVRSSRDRKDLHYFLSKGKWFFYFVLSTFVFLGLRIFIMNNYLLPMVNGIGNIIILIFSGFFLNSSLFWISLFFSPLLVIYFLFYLDSPGTFLSLFKCAGRFCKLVFYMLPFFLVSGIVTFVTVTLVYLMSLGFIFVLDIFVLPHMRFFDFAVHIIPLYFVILVLPLFFCLMSSFYSKAIHDHYDLYA